MKKRVYHFNVKIPIIVGILAGMFSMSALAQGYQSFFGANKTTYNIFNSITTKAFIDKDANCDHNLLGIGFTRPYKILATDTISIHDTIYFKASGCGEYLREDTSSGHLYCYIPRFKQEFLTCDMSLDTGGYFVLPDYSLFEDSGWDSYRYQGEGDTMRVDSVSYINGRKIIYFAPCLARTAAQDRLGIPMTFIEGIGPLYGPFGYMPQGLSSLLTLLCVEKDDTLTYMTDPRLGCNQWSVKMDIPTMKTIKLFPNPASSELHIELQDEVSQQGILWIMDAIGQVVFTKTNLSAYEIISIEWLAAGFYTVQYQNKDRKLQIKFIKK